MKSKLLILLSFLFLTACSTIEIEEYAIIAGIGIDYQDEMYIVSYEIYEDNQGEVTSISSYTIKGIGKDVGGAIISTEQKIEQESYLNHCRVVVLSETIINEQLSDVMNFLVHDPRMRSLEYIVISKGISPYDLFNKEKKEKVLSMQLYKDIKKNRGVAGIYDNCKFVTIANSIQNKRRALVIPTITYDDVIIFTGAKVFNCCKLKKEITSEEVFIIQILDNLLKKGLTSLNDESIFIKSFKSNKKYKNNIIIINFYFNILSYDKSKYNLSSIDEEEAFINDFNEMITKETSKVLKEYQENEIDPFGIIDYIFDFHPLIFKKQKEIFEFYKQLDFKINVYTKIITTGFIERNME